MLDQQKLDLYMMTNQKYFPEEKIVYIRERISQMDEASFTTLSTVSLKEPTTFLLVSIFLGGLGIDRFMLGETGMGLLKLLTGGCCGILTIVDWFTISKKTKEKNFNAISSLL